MPSIITVNRLSKIYEFYKKQAGLAGSLKSLFHREKLFTEAVKNVSFSIEKGELVGFLGPNGAGKTTTLKMLSGILHPTSGTATVLGFTPWKRQKEFQKQFALVVGQKNQLWWDLPAMESFLLNKEIYEVPEKKFRATLDELVSILDIGKLLDVQVRKLSLGERMKCELVAALLHDPKVLFLDEPTIGLDVVSQQHIRDFLKKYNAQRKTTILLTSHYMEDIVALCERVIIISHGAVIFDGKLQRLVETYAKQKILDVTFAEPVREEELHRFGEIRGEWSPQHAVLHVPKKEVKRVAIELMRELPVDDLLINEVNIDDVIREIFTAEEGARVKN